MITDDTLPAVASLTGDDHGDVLAEAVAATGGTLEASRVVEIVHEPGVSCTVTYDVEVRWQDSTTTETYVAMTAADGIPEGAAVLEHGDLAVGVWRFPYDPALPALAEVLGGAGWLTAITGTVDSITIKVYRPGRRAVIRVVGTDRSVVVKLLQGRRGHDAVALHEQLARLHVAVPTVRLADPSRALLVMDALDVDGAALLRDRFVSAPLPQIAAFGSAAALAPMLDRLWSVDSIERPTRRSPRADAIRQLSTLAAVAPALARRAEALAGRFRQLPAPHMPPRTVHGDLHDGQIVVDDTGLPTTLLDLDDVGRGHPADDLGSMLGHALTLALVVESTGDTDRAKCIREWAGGVWALAATFDIPVSDVAIAAAATTAALATGPFRVRESGWQAATSVRLDACDALLAEAGVATHS